MITEATILDTLATALDDSGLFGTGCVGTNNLDTLLDQTGAVQKAPYAVVRSADSFIVDRSFGEGVYVPVYDAAFTPLVLLAMAYNNTGDYDAFTTLRDGVVATLVAIDGSCCYVTRIEAATEIVPFERVGAGSRTVPEFFGQALAVTVQR